MRYCPPASLLNEMPLKSNCPPRLAALVREAPKTAAVAPRSRTTNLHRQNVQLGCTGSLQTAIR